jgi:hypothetical protein
LEEGVCAFGWVGCRIRLWPVDRWERMKEIWGQ